MSFSLSYVFLSCKAGPPPADGLLRRAYSAMPPTTWLKPPST